MATYVNDLRLKEIATGDEAGTWGTSTNTNLELIAEAFSFGTELLQLMLILILLPLLMGLLIRAAVSSSNTLGLLIQLAPSL